MKNKYFYQIKNINGESSFDSAVVHQGITEAKDKDEAKEILSKELNAELLEKISRKRKEELQNTSTRNNDVYRIFLTPLTSHWEEYWLSERECNVCKGKYNILESRNMGVGPTQYSCSRECESKYIHKKEIDKFEEYYQGYGKNLPVIYKITNKKTNKVYIGKTSQCFTLRWYQHFFCNVLSEAKFHEEIKQSYPTDWMFEVIEIIETKNNRDPLISEREQYWINYYDSINSGYNSVVAKKSNNQEGEHKDE